MVKPLYKTTIIIWSEYNPEDVELDDIASDATNGESYCTTCTHELVPDPEFDPDWDNTEFFDEPDEVLDD